MWKIVEVDVNAFIITTLINIFITLSRPSPDTDSINKLWFFQNTRRPLSSIDASPLYTSKSEFGTKSNEDLWGYLFFVGIVLRLCRELLRIFSSWFEWRLHYLSWRNMTFPPVVLTEAMIGLSSNGVLGIVMILKVVQGEAVDVVLVQRDQEVNHKLYVMKME